MKWLTCFIILSVAGCASSSLEKVLEKESFPDSIMDHSSSPVSQFIDYIKEWVGEYEGVGDFFIREETEWYRKRLIQIIIRVERKNTLYILQKTAGLGERFCFLTEVDNPTSIIGESVIGEWRTKYEYSLSKDGNEISGIIKRYAGESEYGPFLPDNEWVIRVRKKM